MKKCAAKILRDYVYQFNGEKEVKDYLEMISRFIDESENNTVDKVITDIYSNTITGADDHELVNRYERNFKIDLDLQTEEGGNEKMIIDLFLLHKGFRAKFDGIPVLHSITLSLIYADHEKFDGINEDIAIDMTSRFSTFFEFIDAKKACENSENVCENIARCTDEKTFNELQQFFEKTLNEYTGKIVKDRNMMFEGYVIKPDEIQDEPNRITYLIFYPAINVKDAKSDKIMYHSLYCIYSIIVPDEYTIKVADKIKLDDEMIKEMIIDPALRMFGIDV
jgi:hypothetical protein